MSDRPPYIVIKADEATAGMISWSRGQVITSKEYIAGVLVFLFGSDRSGYYRLDELVPVQLPGPSPRELLCSCNEWQLGQGADNAGLPASVPCGSWSTMVPPVHHADDCPVCRLRLRLWPVGATWVDSMWLVPLPNGSVHISPELAISWLTDRGDLAETLRAAFCEPEVQP